MFIYSSLWTLCVLFPNFIKSRFRYVWAQTPCDGTVYNMKAKVVM